MFYVAPATHFNISHNNIILRNTLILLRNSFYEDLFFAWMASSFERSWRSVFLLQRLFPCVEISTFRLWEVVILFVSLFPGKHRKYFLKRKSNKPTLSKYAFREGFPSFILIVRQSTLRVTAADWRNCFSQFEQTEFGPDFKNGGS